MLSLRRSLAPSPVSASSVWKSLSPAEKLEEIKKIRLGENSVPEAAQELGISKTVLYKSIQKVEKGVFRGLNGRPKILSSDSQQTLKQFIDEEHIQKNNCPDRKPDHRFESSRSSRA